MRGRSRLATILVVLQCRYFPAGAAGCQRAWYRHGPILPSAGHWSPHTPRDLRTEGTGVTALGPGRNFRRSAMLVLVAVTFDKMSDLPKLSAQLTRLGATEVSPEPSEHKVYGRVPITQLHRLSLLRFAERSFLVLHRRFLNVDGNDPVFSGDISSLEDALRTSDWARAISCWSTLHGRAPNSWVADSKRSNATHKMFAAHGIDRLVLQHTTRAALGEVRARCPYLCVVYA
jgi:hypothetical protein